MNQYVLDAASRLNAMGHQVALVHGRRVTARFKGAGYLFDHLGEHTPLQRKSREKLLAIAEDFEPDVIQLHGVRNHHVDTCLAGKWKTVRFVHNHESYCSGGAMTWRRPLKPCSRAHGRACLLMHGLRGCGAANPVRNWVRHRRITSQLDALRQLHGILVASHAIGDNLLRNGIAKERVTRIPLYAPPPLEKRSPAKSSTRMILHVGGLLSRKGMWLAVRMVRHLPENAELVFAGGGDERENIERHVKSRGLGDRIRIFPDPSPRQWDELYRQASLIILPCLWNEPVGLAALRGFAYGKPVAAFDSGGVGEWLADGETGRLFPLAGRRKFLTEAIELLNDTVMLERMGAAAKRVWQQHYRPDIHLEALVAYYHRLTR